MSNDSTSAKLLNCILSVLTNILAAIIGLSSTVAAGITGLPAAIATLIANTATSATNTTTLVTSGFPFTLAVNTVALAAPYSTNYPLTNLWFVASPPNASFFEVPVNVYLPNDTTVPVLLTVNLETTPPSFSAVPQVIGFIGPIPSGSRFVTVE